jgi:putative IMPACT (imprinted ancient) family translation regulator
MASKKRAVVDRNAKMKVIEASEKDKLTMKQIVGKFKIGKAQVYNILKSKSDIKHEWLTDNGSMKRKLKKSGNVNIHKIVCDWFISTRTKKSCVSGHELNGNLLIMETNYGPVGFC